MRRYLRGLMPLVISLLVINFKLDVSGVEPVWTWWSLYLLLNYGLFFPSVDGWLRTGSVKQIKQFHPKSDQEAMRLGANYANTGHTGVGRIGDASGDSRLSNWGTDFILRLLIIWFGVFWYLWLKLKK
ncbi:hypothetical protein [Levilactobacillus tongjiangensis]|nr:hypothetical protein [Levilactobacillus tongjiangensis]